MATCSAKAVAASGGLFFGPGLFYGVVVRASVTGGDVTVYDGNDATSGLSLGTYVGVAAVSNPVLFSTPVRVYTGLYVKIGSSITDVLVLYQEGLVATPEKGV
jgi:hypothetical protein